MQAKGGSVGRRLETAAGLALMAALALLGEQLVRWVDLPGPVLGLGVYMLMLASGRFGWTLRGARWLAGGLGALIVAPLVAVGGNMQALAGHALPLALAFVAGVAVTGVTTALVFVAADRR